MFDAPWTVVVAVNHALTVISWFENLPTEEQPPRHIWYSADKVDSWFRDVEKKRAEKHGNPGKRSSYDEADDQPMTRNELAESVRAKHAK